MNIIKFLLKPESPEFFSEDITVMPSFQKFEVPVNELQTAFNTTVYNGLSIVSLGLACLYMIVGVTNFFLLPKPLSLIMPLIALIISIFYFLSGIAIRRSIISSKMANPLGALFTVIPMLHDFFLGYFLPSNPVILTLVLAIIGGGCFLLSLRWLLLVVAFAVTGWGWLMWCSSQTNWGDHAIILFSSIVLSYLVFASRLHALRQLETLNIKYKFRKTELESVISDKEKTNKHLEETLKKFTRIQDDLRLLINSINGIVWEVDVKSLDFIFVSKKAGEILGYPITQWFEEKDFWKNHLYLEDKEKAITSWQEGVKNKESHSIEYRMVAANGKVVWFKDLVTVMAENDSVVKIAGVMLDITDRKEIELAAIRSERRYRDLFENANDIIYSHDLAGNFFSVNSYTEKLLGYSPGEVLGMNVSQILNPEDLDRVKERIKRRLAGESFPAQELELISKDGRKVIVETSSWLELEKGQPIAIHGISRDITQRKQAEELLKVARDEALEAANLKSQFLANMSHEIRTPLNGVIGMTYLLLDTQLTEKQLEYVETIHSCGDSLLSIIDDILDLAKIEAGKLELEEIDFDLKGLVEEVVKIFTDKANKKELKLFYEVDQAVPFNLLGDPNRLRQILVNLVGNAIKFTEKGSVTLVVKVEQIEKQVVTIRFEVIDTGIGITKEACSKLFQPFVQADNSTTRKYGGTGLGLAICKELAEKMSGKIGLESSLTKGSTFWFTVKLVKQDIVSMPQADKLVKVFLKDSRDPEIKPETKPEIKPEIKAKILLVEDNPVNQSVAISILNKFGCNVDVVDNGLKALGSLFTNSYDLIFMDCQMPVMDGYETTIAIREREIKNSDDKHIPIVALTAGVMQQNYERCLECGMDDYVSKPFKPEQISAVLKKWLYNIDKNGWSRTENKPIFQQQIANDKIVTLDLSMLAQLVAVSPDESNSFFNRIVKLFLKTADESLNKINSLVQDKNIASIRKEAHKLKSACGNIGAVKMANICFSLEKLEDLANPQYLVDELNLEYELIKKEFSKLGVSNN